MTPGYESSCLTTVKPFEKIKYFTSGYKYLGSMQVQNTEMNECWFSQYP